MAPFCATNGRASSADIRVLDVLTLGLEVGWPSGVHAGSPLQVWSDELAGHPTSALAAVLDVLGEAGLRPNVSGHWASVLSAPSRSTL